LPLRVVSASGNCLRRLGLRAELGDRGHPLGVGGATGAAVYARPASVFPRAAIGWACAFQLFPLPPRRPSRRIASSRRRSRLGDRRDGRSRGNSPRWRFAVELRGRGHRRFASLGCLAARSGAAHGGRQRRGRLGGDGWKRSGGRLADGRGVGFGGGVHQGGGERRTSNNERRTSKDGRVGWRSREGVVAQRPRCG
jgi:hypothetical protein